VKKKKKKTLLACGCKIAPSYGDIRHFITTKQPTAEYITAVSGQQRHPAVSDQKLG